MKLNCDEYSGEYEDGYYGRLRKIEIVLRQIRKGVNYLLLRRLRFWNMLKISFHPRRNHVMDWPWYNVILPGGPGMFYLDFGRSRSGPLRLLVRVEVGSENKAVVSNYYSSPEINQIIRREFTTLPDMKLIFAD